LISTKKKKKKKNYFIGGDLHLENPKEKKET
jgi:hypothetical protein